MEARPVVTILASETDTSDESLDESDVEPELCSSTTSSLTGRTLRRVASATMLTTLLVAGVWLAMAWSRGQAAAAAALVAAHSVQESVLLDAFSSAKGDGNSKKVAPLDAVNTLMLQRAGRSPDLAKRPQPENTALAWAMKRQEQEDGESLNSLGANLSAIASKAEVSIFNLSAIASKAEVADPSWTNEWFRQEINQGLAAYKEEINTGLDDQLKEAQANPQSAMSGAASDSGLQIDSVTGLDSVLVEEMRCYEVAMDPDAGTGLAYILMKAGARSPLACGGKAPTSSSGGGSYYPFTLQINGFWAHARRLETDLELGAPPKLLRTYVGWVDSGYNELDATCFQKNDDSHSKVDQMCTDFMNKELQQKKGDLIWSMSKTITERLQTQMDSMVSKEFGTDGHAIPFSPGDTDYYD